MPLPPSDKCVGFWYSKHRMLTWQEIYEDKLLNTLPMKTIPDALVNSIHGIFPEVWSLNKLASCDSYLTATQMTTPIGAMTAIADDTGLHFLAFSDSKALPREIAKLRYKTKKPLVQGRTASLLLLEKELNSYFAGKSTTFTVPVHLGGSAFQKKVWQGLLQVPYGKTSSYLDQTLFLGYDRHKVRAVGNANGANQLTILFPCHRIINHNGALGGYGGGLHRKKWLLLHEKKHSNT